MTNLGQFDGMGLSTYLVKKLQQKGFTTKHELLISNNLELMEITGFSDVAILEMKQKLAEDYFPRQQHISNSNIYKTGIKSIDDLTAKIPLKTGSVWEITGKAGIGKTQLCQTIAVNFVERTCGAVLYVDTKSDFSGTRIMEMLRSRNIPNTDCGRIMQDILVERTNTANGVCDVLAKLASQLLAGAEADGSNIKLVIIDALPAVFFTYRTETKRLKGNYLLATLNNLIYKLAKEYYMAFVYINLLMDCEEEQPNAEDANLECDAYFEDILTTSSTYSNKSLRPALGEYWSRAPRLRLALEWPVNADYATDERSLRILRSCYSAVGAICSLRITSAGILSITNK
ncbi:DNA repair protein RAD51 homolog 4 [Eurosta solidaginis]|uniref:DNA repair protein RAD51 homolog 4 n=1 Tax=Eurosta solidaginis TaxID=178769 RepID=UPI003530E4BB